MPSSIEGIGASQFGLVFPSSLSCLLACLYTVVYYSDINGLLLLLLQSTKLDLAFDSIRAFRPPLLAYDVSIALIAYILDRCSLPITPTRPHNSTFCLACPKVVQILPVCWLIELAEQAVYSRFAACQPQQL